MARPPADFIRLTGETVTDDMIRRMRDVARGVTGDVVEPDLVVTCSRALRHPSTCKTELELAGRRAARRACAREINDRAEQWVRGGHATNVLYAQLVGLAVPEPPARAKQPNARTQPYVLCWECNDVIRPDQRRLPISVHGGRVLVHASCSKWVDPNALDESKPPRTLDPFTADHDDDDEEDA